MGSCDDSDVIIAGGGPVGLLLACELRLAEVGVVVLERTPDGADEPRQVGGASAEASREGACVVKGRPFANRWESAKPVLMPGRAWRNRKKRLDTYA